MIFQDLYVDDADDDLEFICWWCFFSINMPIMALLFML